MTFTICQGRTILLCNCYLMLVRHSKVPAVAQHSMPWYVMTVLPFSPLYHSNTKHNTSQVKLPESSPVWHQLEKMTEGSTLPGPLRTRSLPFCHDPLRGSDLRLQLLYSLQTTARALFSHHHACTSLQSLNMQEALRAYHSVDNTIVCPYLKRSSKLRDLTGEQHLALNYCN